MCAPSSAGSERATNTVFLILAAQRQAVNPLRHGLHPASGVAECRHAPHFHLRHDHGRQVLRPGRRPGGLGIPETPVKKTIWFAFCSKSVEQKYWFFLKMSSGIKAQRRFRNFNTIEREIR
jgi:hypothetical protein